MLGPLDGTDLREELACFCPPENLRIMIYKFPALMCNKGYYDGSWEASSRISELIKLRVIYVRK